MSDTSTGHGLGKIILCGEHAVVYGHPAIALAVDRRVTVTLHRRPGRTAFHPSVASDSRLEQAVEFALPQTGLEVQLESSLPMGRGMGSSAAFAVALVRAKAQLMGETADLDTIYQNAFAIEQIFHGNPSGLDHAVSSRGGALFYRRGPPPEFETLPCPDWSLIVLDSGTSGDTSAMVTHVAGQRPSIDPTLQRIGELVQSARSVLNDPPALGELLNENHTLLRSIGVSTPKLDELTQLARQAGAWGAKLAGAGGGGVVVALTQHPEALLATAGKRDIAAFSCRPMER